ncbi:murein lipoprotein [Budviciaceae bacterium BWR-B9]|uniref:Major outer membrane lipoprotein Lpp n=3 Tax=Limnobaculum TaxID=2172100 RepID=A0A9D7AHQ8_9GAMM|nr:MULTISPECIES: LPP leucine zipper domain-containing protein [Limnobaculum]MBK5072949.1 murein lipoprotein [Limnobaculum xujianqingii]MBK5142362.1 murein lipoprotein [Limnobaculum allomyrinae]MBK5176258.1 murein lipoprotein [Limnobaculum xujianqingii]MBV7690753.1 murein lipoprotein [Limnobaculum sp. M2-1]QBH96388.1 murein lipoprotein [Limnobaculum zhutongyuii]
MNRTKVVLGAVILGATLLAGCAKSTDTSTNSKLTQLISDVAALRSDVQVAKDEAARANQRLDNMTRSYKK